LQIPEGGEKWQLIEEQAKVFRMLGKYQDPETRMAPGERSVQMQESQDKSSAITDRSIQ
jgi:hypothetical protein